MKNRILVVAGPTAVGKTKYTLKIAEYFNGEIVSADSMQLYKYLNIGSAKPSKDELSRVKHHLVGDIDPKEIFSVALYQKLAKNAINSILEKGRLPIITGGTGLYINSLIYDMDFAAPPAEKDYRCELYDLAALYGNDYIHERLSIKDPDAARRIHPNNLKKVIRALEVIENAGSRIKPFPDSFVPAKDYDTILICLNRERRELYARIDARVDILIEKGLIDEVRSLLDLGLNKDDISMKGIGYKEIIGYLDGEYDQKQAITLIKQNTRRYAKRQLTWLRRYENMKWFNLSEYENGGDAFEEIITWLTAAKQKK
jgi:tRNA dimethylallyltransferase